MKSEYKVGEDLFIALGTFLITAAMIMKLFNVPIRLWLTAIYPRHFVQLGALFLLLSIAINVQDLVKK
ncbi:MAG: hypothetical protein JSW40_03110 [Candidatus Omnitrophota bacterium]|nr:MAG: hypothetical protein JSW40_03110 [Candidatus Omnitrophota bacterium]